MSPLLKAKLILTAFCLVAVAASELYLKGIDAGVAGIDQEAFDSYVTFARQMHAETHRPTPQRRVERDNTVWAAVDQRGR
jgi:hypothetical protein